MRTVERFTAYGEPLAFRELAARAVPTDAHYVVLDLDRTVHLDRNMGELLGWEVAAYRAYGERYFEEVEPRRGPGRMAFDRAHPLDSMRYLALGARAWGAPGLHYLLWGKTAARFAPIRKVGYRRFGPEPVQVAQSIPQHALFRELAHVPLAKVRELVARVYARHAADMVIEADDIRWLRQHAPAARIVLCSASPAVMVAFVAEALGADDWIASEVEERDGFTSTPWSADGPLPPDPYRLASPSTYRINAGAAKLDALVSRYPDIERAGTVRVGISDTGYGEDHAFARLFTHVIDVNSASPFPVLVAAGAPLVDVSSARVLSRHERDVRARGEPHYVDPRRNESAVRRADRVVERPELERLLAASLARASALAVRMEAERLSASAERSHIGRELAQVRARLDDCIAAWNEGDDEERDALAPELRLVRRRHRALEQARARLDRKCSRLSCALDAELVGSRLSLEGPSRAAPGIAA
jgi:hypothetical protein